MRGKGKRPDEAVLAVCEWCLVYEDITVADLATRVWEHAQHRKEKDKRFSVQGIGMLIASMAEEEYFGEYHDGAARDFLEFMRFIGTMDFGHEPMHRNKPE